MLTKPYTWIKNNNSFERRTKRLDATCLVILFLFTNEKEPYTGILNHILYLLFRTCGVERNTNHPHTVCTKFCIKMVNTVLWEHSNRLLRFHPKVQKSVWNLLYTHWELIPWHCTPLQTTKVTEGNGCFSTVFFRLFMYKNRKMTDCLHCFPYFSSSLQQILYLQAKLIDGLPIILYLLQI